MTLSLFLVDIFISGCKVLSSAISNAWGHVFSPCHPRKSGARIKPMHKENIIHSVTQFANSYQQVWEDLLERAAA
jgi:hypothetical protein